MCAKPLNRRLSPIDAAFVYSETNVAPMHIGGIDILDGQLDLEKFRALLDSKMQLIPRYRQRLVPAPLNLAHPSWEDDPEFSIDNHVELATLPEPGTEEELKVLTGELFGGVLDRDKPLWKVYVIHGLEGNKSALLWLVHHCMVDGISGTELLQVALETSPNSEPIEKQPYEARPMPDRTKLGIDAVWDTLEQQIEHQAGLSRRALGLLRTLRGDSLTPLLRHAPELLRDFAKPVKKLPFNRRNFSGKRKLSWSSCSFAEVRAIRKACGGTVNDVILTVLGGAIRRYMEKHGIPTRGQNLRIAAPVSLRTEDQRDSLGNQVTILPVDVPLGTKCPIKRLGRVEERTTILKEARLAHFIDLFAQVALGALPWVRSPVEKTAFRPGLQPFLDRLMVSPVMHMVCTNIPGPQIPLYACGHRVRAHVPLLPIAPGMGLNMGVFSYNQRIYFGYIADTGVADDVEEFRGFVDEAFTELRDAAGVQAIEEVSLRELDPAAQTAPAIAPPDESDFRKILERASRRRIERVKDRESKVTESPEVASAAVRAGEIGKALS